MTSDLRLIKACLALITTLITLSVAFLGALTVVTTLDAPDEGEIGFFLAIGTLDSTHALVALMIAITITVVSWVAIITLIRLQGPAPYPVPPTSEANSGVEPQDR